MCVATCVYMCSNYYDIYICTAIIAMNVYVSLISKASLSLFLSRLEEYRLRLQLTTETKRAIVFDQLKL